VLLCFALIAASPAPAPDASFARLHSDDLVLATVAQRLAVANVARCKDSLPATGFVIAAIDQYPPEARAKAASALGFNTAIGIETVVPGSPAERAGVLAGDGLLEVEFLGLAKLEPFPAATSVTRDGIERLIANFPPGEELSLVVSRSGQTIALKLKPVPACRVRFEVIQSDLPIARGNGDTIQLSSGFIETFGEDAVAVAFAHELAHVVLHHGTRASKRNEREADRLSLHLLAAADYDPRIAPRFWREHGTSMGTRGHDSVQDRIKLLEAEIAAIGAKR
jgi:hypothetical protein